MSLALVSLSSGKQREKEKEVLRRPITSRAQSLDFNLFRGVLHYHTHCSLWEAQRDLDSSVVSSADVPVWTDVHRYILDAKCNSTETHMHYRREGQASPRKMRRK